MIHMLTQISQITQNYNYAECLASRESHEVRIVTLANCTAQTLGEADSCERSNAAFCEIAFGPFGRRTRFVRSV